MKVTRHGVFETNSSSTHSITIDRGEWSRNHRTHVLPKSDDGICRVFPGEFGCEVREYNDTATKASYVLTYIFEQRGVDALAKKGNDKYDHATDISKKISEHLEMLRVVIAERVGRRVEFVSLGKREYGDGDEEDWGYIDHQSVHVCVEAFESHDALRDFIFNSKSILRTDNDNHN